MGICEPCHSDQELSKKNTYDSFYNALHSKNNRNISNSQMTSKSENSIVVNGSKIILGGKNEYEIFENMETPNPDLKAIIEIPAIIGETEYSIYVNKNDLLIFNTEVELDKKTNRISEWQYYDETTTFEGYPNKIYNEAYEGCLVLRISNSNKKFYFTQEQSLLKAWESGSILFSANLNPDSLYHPDGSLTIQLIGGKKTTDEEIDKKTGYDLEKFYKNNQNEDMQSIEMKILRYINKARINFYKYKQDFINDKMWLEKFNKNENKGVNDIYKRKLDVLLMDNQLKEIAAKIGKELCKLRTSGHNGTDIKNFSESIVFGQNNPILITNELIKDQFSKSESKDNLKNLMNEEFCKVGIFFGNHQAYRYCCVLVFSK